MPAHQSDIDNVDETRDALALARLLADGLAREQSTLDTWHRMAVPDQGNGYHSCRGCGTGWYEPRGLDQESPHKTDCWVVPLLGFPSSDRVDERVYARLEAGRYAHEGTRDALRYTREDVQKAIQRAYHERSEREKAEAALTAERQNTRQLGQEMLSRCERRDQLNRPCQSCRDLVDALAPGVHLHNTFTCSPHVQGCDCAPIEGMTCNPYWTPGACPDPLNS